MSGRAGVLVPWDPQKVGTGPGSAPEDSWRSARCDVTGMYMCKCVVLGVKLGLSAYPFFPILLRLSFPPYPSLPISLPYPPSYGLCQDWKTVEILDMVPVMRSLPFPKSPP